MRTFAQEQQESQQATAEAPCRANATPAVQEALASPGARWMDRCARFLNRVSVMTFRACACMRVLPLKNRR